VPGIAVSEPTTLFVYRGTVGELVILSAAVRAICVDRSDVRCALSRSACKLSRTICVCSAKQSCTLRHCHLFFRIAP
jgi:hypothetical protein